MTRTPRAFVVGMGEVGRRLAASLGSAGWKVLPVTRERGLAAALDAEDPAPRLVAVREEDLGGLLDRFRLELRGRLLLVQNGYLEAVYGDLGPVARGLIYFTAKGEFFEPLCPSVFHGPGADAVARALDSGGIPARAEPRGPAFLVEMVVKGIWNAVVGLPLAVHGVTLERYLERHRDEMQALAEEGALAAGAEYGVEVRGSLAVRRILETTEKLGWVRGGAKALAFRNGAISRFGRRHGIPTPVNDALLHAVGFELD